jgi:hypothetical protein
MTRLAAALIRIAAVATVLGVGVLAAGGTGAGAKTPGVEQAVTKTISFTTADTCKHWTAPRYTTSMQIETIGAAGSTTYAAQQGPSYGGAPGYSDGEWVGSGGRGDEVKAALSGPLGAETFDVCVDTGSVNGSLGGGASGVSVGGDFSHPAVVAGGGGDGGVGCDGVAGTPYASECAAFPHGKSCCNGGNAGAVGGSGGGVPTLSYSQLSGGGGGGPLLPGLGGHESGGQTNRSFAESTDGESGGFTNSQGPGQGGGDGDDGGNGYTGGGSGALFSVFPPPNGDIQDPTYYYYSGAGGGSDFCVPKTKSEGSVKLPRGFSTSDCKIISGAGTKPDAGSGRGDAKVVITYKYLPPSAALVGSHPLSLSPPTVSIIAPTGSATFDTSGTTGAAGVVGSVTGGQAPIAKWTCKEPGIKKHVNACEGVVTLAQPPSNVPHAAHQIKLHASGVALPNSIGGSYPACAYDTLSVTASYDGKIGSATRSYCVYVASSMPPRVTPPHTARGILAIGSL